MNNEIIKALVSYVSAGKITVESIKDKAQRDAVVAEIESINLSKKKYDEEVAKRLKEEAAVKAAYEKKLAEAKAKMEEKKALIEAKKREEEALKQEAVKAEDDSSKTETVTAPQSTAKTKKTTKK